MRIEVLYRPAHSLAKVGLSAGESVVAESGALVGMSTNVRMQTSSGGVVGGLKRMFGGESFFRNTFTAEGSDGEVLLAHALCGDMVALEMTPQGYYLQSSAFVASTAGVDVQTRIGGLKSLFAGEGLFLLQATSRGAGSLLVGAFGGVEEIAVDGHLAIDTGHLVAWDGNLQWSVGRSGAGWVASWLSGEGLVCRFEGRGRVWIQTRNPAAYGREVGRLLPPRKE
ncbi:MAG: TIGR00266 family protein [Myxococcota bacterium]